MTFFIVFNKTCVFSSLFIIIIFLLFWLDYFKWSLLNSADSFFYLIKYSVEVLYWNFLITLIFISSILLLIFFFTICISLLSFSFCTCIIFLISFSCLPMFSCISLISFKLIIFKSWSGNSPISFFYDQLQIYFFIW